MRTISSYASICVIAVGVIAVGGIVCDSASGAVDWVGPILSADVNNDGFVNGQDYLIIQRSNPSLIPDLESEYGLNNAFENPAIWSPDVYDPEPAAGPETAPPGDDSIWFGQGNAEDVVVVLTDERSGLNGTEMMGVFSYGGESDDGPDDFDSKFTLVLNNSVTLTGIERDDLGEPEGLGGRPLRSGRADFNPIAPQSGGTTEDFPWAILLHRAGTLTYAAGITGGARLDMARSSTNSAGALYEISGNAVLDLAGTARMGDRPNGGNRTTPGAVFRVRGSNATITVEDYKNESRLGLWDHDNNVDDDNSTGITQINLGKYVTEFVLDQNGGSTIQVNDELQLGREESIGADPNIEFGYAFMRLKLSEPTSAGSGAPGSGDEIVLAKFGRLTSSFGSLAGTGSEIFEGRWFDPDRSGPNSSGTNTLPHDPHFDGDLVTAEYAGATYQWTINYWEGVGSAPDPSLDDSIVLSGLSITGTPGDLSGNGTLGAEDRAALEAAIASPPQINIASAQNLFDLNADAVVDSLDLDAFDTHFGGSLLAAAAAVPEPSSLILMLAGICIPLGRRSRLN